MGRAPNPGAPQRVSAHVVPKAPSFPASGSAIPLPVVSPSDEEEEKTTIESGGWEEEASTTVEQGEVADKVRALGLEQARRPNTGITSTSGDSVSDEPTVDEPRGAAALALLPPPRIARLEITQGNDLGQAIEVRPGKTYTIGRGIDNDLVLTDMTVSRKHFELRHDAGAWVLADRGSGNGTLVNNQLEDAPFLLANGDVIEIGNTIFRFEQPDGAPRAARYDGASDEELEQSTASGAPLSSEEPATPDRMMTPLTRPKTLPPPAPRSRPRAQSNRPPTAIERPGASSRPPTIPPIVYAAVMSPTIVAAPGLPPLHAPPPLAPAPATTLPMPQMASRAPLQPTTLFDPAHKQLTTIPGQGPTIQPPHLARLPFSFSPTPNSGGQGGMAGGQSTELPRQRRSAILPGVTVAPSMPGRDGSSTALVPPAPYRNGQPARQAYGQPPVLTRRMKMALAACGVALFAAVATIAILKGVSGDAPVPGSVVPLQDPKPATADEPSRDAKATRPADAPGAIKPTVSRPPGSPTSAAAPPNADPRVDPRPEKIAPIVTPIVPPTTATPPNPAATSPNAAPSGATTTPTAPQAKPASPAPGAPGAGLAAPAPTAKDASVPSPAIAASPRLAGSTTSTTSTTSSTTPPSVQTTTRADKPQGSSAASVARADKPQGSSAAAGARVDKPRRNDRNDRSDRSDKKAEKRSPPSRSDADKIEIEPQPPRRHGGKSLLDVKNDAAVLYRRKDFTGAAAIVTAAVPSTSGVDAQELKTITAIYLQLGKSYNVGMAPGTKATDAFVALRRAINYDREVGAAYVNEMQEKLVVIAARAAMLYMAAKDYEAAFQAVRASDALGSQSPSNKTVREKLDSVAAELYRAAQSEMASDSEAAKQKLRQVLNIVEPKSPVYARASRLLNGP